MTEATDVVVRRQIVVEAPIERAFTVFTQRFGDFKPPEHNLLGAPIAQTVFEPKVGGHIYDRGPGWPAVSDGVGHDQGWTLYLNRYGALLGEDR